MVVAAPTGTPAQTHRANPGASAGAVSIGSASTAAAASAAPVLDAAAPPDAGGAIAPPSFAESQASAHP
jgi:hypothetical protein